MQIPDSATVRPYLDVEPRALVLGREGTDGYLAIRTGRGDEPDDARLAVLSPNISDDHESPFLFRPQQAQHVLDLGKDWSIDVPLDAGAFYPNRAIRVDPTAILLRAGGRYFLDFGINEGFVALDDGIFIDQLPDTRDQASWNVFSICYPQKHIAGPGAVIFSWPE